MDNFDEVLAWVHAQDTYDHRSETCVVTHFGGKLEPARVFAERFGTSRSDAQHLYMGNFGEIDSRLVNYNLKPPLPWEERVNRWFITGLQPSSLGIDRIGKAEILEALEALRAKYLHVV